MLPVQMLVKALSLSGEVRSRIDAVETSKARMGSYL